MRTATDLRPAKHKTSLRRPHLPRFLPLQRFPDHGEPLTPGWVPSHPVTLHPRGFTPPRRLAPPVACRAYFIPVPLLGFLLRGIDPHPERYALSDALTLLKLVHSPTGPAPFSRALLSGRVPPDIHR